MSWFGCRASLVLGLFFAIAIQSQAQAQWRPFSDDGFSDTSRSQRKRSGQSDKVPPPISQYVLISSSTDQATGRVIARYEQLVASGGWARIPAGPSMKINSHDKRVIALRRRLQLTGELAQGGKLSKGFDRGVHEAVIRFQYRHGLTPSGKVNRFTLKALNVSAAQCLNQLKLNRLRLRKLLARIKGKTYILVNIPGYELQAVSGGQLQLSSRVVSGKPATRTPEVTTAVRAVNFLPYWHVPQSIAPRALIPAVKKDPGYLAREHISVYASWGVQK
jgi:murein L,D-transpeptidase YcbB/YkuD